MSLIISLKCGNGIVTGSDTRTTYTQDTNNRTYVDRTNKIYIGKDFVVAMAGDNQISNQFIYDAVKRTLKNVEKGLVCSKLLITFSEATNVDAVFLVSYFNESEHGVIYRVITKERKIQELTEPNNYGGGYNGVTEIAAALLQDLDYSILNKQCCVELVYKCLETTILKSQYSNTPYVGGKIRIAVLEPSGSITMLEDKKEIENYYQSL